MILYEVNLEIQHGIVSEYLGWLNEHVEEMLKLPGFVEARIFKDQEEDLHFQKHVVHYYLVDESAMNNYLQRFSERMRADAQRRFGRQFRASRRILELPEEDSHLPSIRT